jgi:hypothetical protein
MPLLFGLLASSRNSTRYQCTEAKACPTFLQNLSLTALSQSLGQAESRWTAMECPQRLKLTGMSSASLVKSPQVREKRHKIIAIRARIFHERLFQNWLLPPHNLCNYHLCRASPSRHPCTGKSPGTH